MPDDFLLYALIAFYFLPTIIAFIRNQTNKISILVLNLLLGWTLLGWVVAMVWAFKKPEVISTSR